MKITRQGFQVLLLAVPTGNSKQSLKAWPLSNSTVSAAASEAAAESQQDGFASGKPYEADAAAGWTLLQGGRDIFSSIVGAEFNSLTPENAMKSGRVDPACESYSFCDSDALFSYAAANHMQVRGHTLVWHQQLPEWLSRGDFFRDELIAILRDHIQTVAGSFRAEAVAWDAVDEALAGDTPVSMS